MLMILNAKKREYHQEEENIKKDMVSLFNGISTFVGYLMLKPFS